MLKRLKNFSQLSMQRLKDRIVNSEIVQSIIQELEDGVEEHDDNWEWVEPPRKFRGFGAIKRDTTPSWNKSMFLFVVLI